MNHIKIDRIKDETIQHRLALAVNDLIGKMIIWQESEITGSMNLELHFNAGVINKAILQQKHGLKIY